MNEHYYRGWRDAAYVAAAILLVVAAASPHFEVFCVIAIPLFIIAYIIWSVVNSD